MTTEQAAELISHLRMIRVDLLMIFAVIAVYTLTTYVRK